MELLTFTIAAGETKEFRKAGRYLEIIDSAYAINLLFIGADGNQTDDAIGALSGIFIEETYAAFQVKNGVVAQSITLLIHDGRGGSRRQPGVVQVVDTNKARTIAAQAFSCPASRGAPGAGQYARCGVFNTAGSGKRLVIDKITYSSSAATTFYLGFKNASGGLSAFAKSKLAGSPDSAISRITQDNSATPVDLDSLLIAIPGTGGQIKFDTPVVVMPGYAFVATNSNVNQDLFLTAEFIEEPVT